MKVLVYLAALAAFAVADELDDELATFSPEQLQKLAALYQKTCKPAGTEEVEPTYPKKPEQKEIDWEAERQKVIKANAEKYKQINNGKTADVLTLAELEKKYPDIYAEFIKAGFGDENVKKLTDANPEKAFKKKTESVEKKKDIK